MCRTSFPVLRTAFGQFAQEMLRADDFKVRIGGTRNEVLNVYHASFVRNRGIQTAHEKILNYLQDFNFQRACYGWRDSAERTCYPVASTAAP